MIVLGFSIENPNIPKGDVKNLNMKIKIYPDSYHIKFVCGAPNFNRENGWELSNPCNEEDNKYSGNFEFKGREDNYYKFDLAQNRIDSTSVLNDKTELYYLTMFVSSELLSKSLYQGIFVQSELDYDFEMTIDTDFRITPATG
jgi:hypothetical protein